MTELWTDITAAQATGGKNQGGSWSATRVKIDSRAIGAGDLFVAIKGETFDGHDYVKESLEKGAVAAIVSHIPAGCETGKLLMVGDTLKALEGLGISARKGSKARVVGVTGSVGKNQHQGNDPPRAFRARRDLCDDGQHQ